MIIGVPVFATFFYIIKKAAEAILRRRNLPTDTEEYVRVDYIDEDNQFHYLGEKKKRSSKRKEARARRRKKQDIKDEIPADGSDETK